MTVIVKTVTRLTVSLILIYGIYIVLQGHIGPGGGFAGGVIIALSFIHLLLAFGKDAVLTKLNQVKGIFLASLAALVVLALITVGLICGQKVFLPKYGFGIFSSGAIPLYDLAIALMVGTGLFTIFLELILFIAERKKR